jgi:hypothetical protein
MKENMATTGDVAGHAKPLGSPSPKKIINALTYPRQPLIKLK